MTEAWGVGIRRPAGFDWDVPVTVLLMVALLIPLFVVPGTFFPYVVPRNILFRVVVELAAAIRIVEVLLTGKRFDLRREQVLLALTAFLVAMTISSLFSPARAHSFYGDFERMGGVWAWLHLVMFFLLLRTIGEKYFGWLLHIAFAGGVGASLHAIVGSFSGDSRPPIVGNSGLLAGYLLVSLAVALVLACTRRQYRLLYLLGGAIELCALLFAENRSSALGLAIGGIAASVLLGLGGHRRRRRWLPLAVASLAGAALVSVIAIARTEGSGGLLYRAPGVISRIAATDFNGIDALRTIQWTAALAGFVERPLLGFGPENYHLVWAAHFDPLSEELGEHVFDRAHNQYLEILATTGIVGSLAFLALWWAIGYSLYRSLASRRLGITEFAILAGVNLAYAAYLVFWFVDINAAIIWLLFAAYIAARNHPGPVLRETGRRVSRPLGLAGALATGCALAFILHFHAYVPARANSALATLNSYDGTGEGATAAAETIATSRAEQTSHFAPLLSRYVRLATADASFEAVRGTPRGEQLDRAFQAAISAFDRELSRDPLNDRLHTRAAETLIAASTFYESVACFQRGITLLDRAIRLNPGRSRQRRLLAEAMSHHRRLMDPSEDESAAGTKRCARAASGRPRDES